MMPPPTTTTLALSGSSEEVEESDISDVKFLERPHNERTVGRGAVVALQSGGDRGITRRPALFEGKNIFVVEA